MPIRGRIDMLSTGIRTPVGLKIQGADLDKIQEIGQQTEKLLSAIPGRATCSPSASAKASFWM